MRRLRPIRRRSRQREREELTPPDPASPYETLADELLNHEEDDFAPFVPASDDYTAGTSEIGTETPSAQVRRRRIRLTRPRMPRLRLWRPVSKVRLSVGLLLAVLFLFVAGIFGALLNLNRVPEDVETMWPVAIIVSAMVWLFVALFRRQVASFLGAAAFAGVGLSFWMDTQNIAPLEEALMGVVLVTVGLGIVIRGFLLRQQMPT